MRAPTLALFAFLVGPVAVSGCSDREGDTPFDPISARVDPVTPHDEWAPVLDPADFVPGAINAYYPLVPGTILTYQAETEDGLEIDVVEVTFGVKQIIGINAVVVRDRVYLDENENGLPDGAACDTDPGFTAELIEATFDWYATANDGTVWYLGEDSQEYENCVLVGTAGSWEAGMNDAFPGIIMMGTPVVGQSYRQEYAEGIAEDWGRVLSLGESVSVPFDDFEGCLETMDWTPLEPGHREHKWYCEGIGLVLEVSARGGRVANQLVAKTDP